MVFQLGWRNIWRNKRRTAVILTAVIIGVWAMIFLGALMRGIEDQMVKNGISALGGHVKVYDSGYRRDPVIENRIRVPQKVVDAFESLHRGIRFTGRIRVNAIASNARHSGNVTLVGVDPVREKALSFIGDAVSKGRYLEESDPHGIIAGRALLEKFETRLGNKLVLMSQDASGGIASRAFRIIGVFRTEMESTEKQFVFVTLPASQKMLKVGDDVSEFSALIEDHRDADKVAGALRKRLGRKGFEVYTWKELLPLVTAMLKMYNGFIFFWFLAVFIAIGFGLVNTILMAVFERIREFGLMRSLGMKPRLVVAEVLAESFFLLALGILAGNILGFLSVLALSPTGIDLSAFAQGMEFARMSRIIFPVIEVRDILTADATVLVLGTLVSLYPAMKAARFSPVEAMTHM